MILSLFRLSLRRFSSRDVLSIHVKATNGKDVLTLFTFITFELHHIYNKNQLEFTVLFVYSTTLSFIVFQQLNRPLPTKFNIFRSRKFHTSIGSGWREYCIYYVKIVEIFFIG